MMPCFVQGYDYYLKLPQGAFNFADCGGPCGQKQYEHHRFECKDLDLANTCICDAIMLFALFVTMR